MQDSKTHPLLQEGVRGGPVPFAQRKGTRSGANAGDAHSGIPQYPVQTTF